MRRARAHNLMKCAIAESYTHIGQAQIDKGEVRDRASEEHNRRGDDHTGTPVRERELRVILELTWYTSQRERTGVPGQYMGTTYT